MDGLDILKKYLNDLLKEKESLYDEESNIQAVLLMEILDKIDEIEESKRTKEDMLYG